MHLFYRISDASLNKPHVAGATKMACLKNFLNTFGRSDLKVIADNCNGDTLSFLHDQQLDFEVTNLGNAGSLRHALKMAKEMTGTVYFCEDDYIHRAEAPLLVSYGIALAPYVTLYDHPDKYGRDWCNGETSQVRRTANSHWRFTQSTCMTFGTTCEAIRDDWNTWMKWTTDEYPADHQIFTELKEDGKELALCIPGAAVHMDLTYSELIGQCTIEDWAMDYLVMEKINAILDLNEKTASLVMSIQQRHEGEKLKLLAILTAMENEVASRKSRGY
jgi:hypothetical protein